MNQAFYVLSAYVFCSAVHCVGLLPPKQRISLLTKPLLMPLLILYYLLAAKEPDILVVAALTAGFLGDVFLMGKGTFFILGLSSFFVGHVFYIAVLLNSVRFASLQAWHVLPAIVFVLYGIWIYRRLRTHAGNIKVAMVPYITVLVALCSFAFIYLAVAQTVKSLAIFTGAVFFITSDSLLSFDLFVVGKRWRSIAVMATYTIAQGLIATGFAM